MLDRVTITGADDTVDINELVLLTDDFPFVEWGVLLSQSRMGQPRYPTFNWIKRLLEAKNAYIVNKIEHMPGKWVGQTAKLFNLSGHLCGRWVRDIENEGIFSIRGALAKEQCWGRGWNRFQINWGSRGAKLDLNQMHSAYSGLTLMSDIPSNHFQFILQCPDGDCGVLDSVRRHLADLDFDAVPLFDGSGGKGKIPSEWPKPWTPYSGYAGGLTPENLEVQYEEIARRVGLSRIWIDAESGVRDDRNRLDLAKVRSFLWQAASWISKVEM